MVIKLIQGQDFSGLEHYLTHAREHEIVSCRGVSTPEAAAEEMALVAAERDDVIVPALHVIYAASPVDWAKMSDPMWDELEQDFEAEFGLGGHQKLVVKHPHPDKRIKGPHRHGAYNKVHPVTFELPPKGREKRSSWDSGAKQRAWQVADAFAERHGLTRVADPTKVESAGRIPNWQLKRELQDGLVPVGAKAAQIRDALHQPDWAARANALADIGLKIHPTYPSQSAERGNKDIAGIRIVDIHDERNFQKASAFGREFGFQALERSRTPGSPDLSEVLASADRPADRERAGASSVFDARALYLLEFERDLKVWRQQSNDLKRRRKKLLLQQKAEARKLTRTLGSERSTMLDATPPSLHGPAREMFRSVVVEPRRTALRARHRAELAVLKPAKRPVWSMWLETKASAGDTKAAELLREMAGRARRIRLKADKAEIASPPEPSISPPLLETANQNPEKGVSSAVQREIDRHPSPEVEVPLPAVVKATTTVSSPTVDEELSPETLAAYTNSREGGRG